VPEPCLPVLRPDRARPRLSAPLTYMDPEQAPGLTQIGRGPRLFLVSCPNGSLRPARPAAEVAPRRTVGLRRAPILFFGGARPRWKVKARGGGGAEREGGRAEVFTAAWSRMSLPRGGLHVPGHETGQLDARPSAARPLPTATSRSAFPGVARTRLVLAAGRRANPQRVGNRRS